MAGRTGDGQRCGAPAVVAHTLSGGQVYTECSEHALASARRAFVRRAATILPGTQVRLTHAGIVKSGRVLSIGRGQARVAVVNAGAVTIVVRALSDIEQLPQP
jgi:hypothetical protein